MKPSRYRSVAKLAYVAIFTSLVIPTTRVCAEKQSDLIPRRVFFGNPDRSSLQISPNGAYISYLAPYDGVMNVWVQSLEANVAGPVTEARERPIRKYFWAHNSEQIIYSLDRAGEENFHLYAVDITTAKEFDLTPYENIQTQFVARDPKFPDEILIAMNNRVPHFHDVWRVNTRTGDGKMVFQNDLGYLKFIADDQFNVRVAERVNPMTGGSNAFARNSVDSEWYELASWNLEDSANSSALSLSRDGKTIYVMDSRDANTGQLFAFTLDESGTATYQLIAEDDRADLNDVFFSIDTGKPLAVAFEYARREWKILDSSIRADWKFLSDVTDGEMHIDSRDDRDGRWIVRYVRDNGPEAFYLYDRSQGTIQFLFTNRSELESVSLAKMKPVEITARDGLKLVSYLTTPPNKKARNLPLVLLVHGGPWGRDSWGYNTIHQWLANRDYVVLSVNFRGSTGLGKDFLNAANRQWAGTMQNDLIDAVNWAVEEKIADPDRVAIMGGSYGGYATLVGLTFTPEFFTCGVDIVGPSHVKTLLESIPPYWAPLKAMFEKRVGGVDETEFLDRISPLSRVDAISRPLLIGQGKNDPRVKEEQSQMIVNAMQEKGLPVTYVVFPDEGHGFARPENSLAFFAMTEAFLAEHLGGRYEPIGTAVEKSSADIQAGADLIPGLARVTAE